MDTLHLVQTPPLAERWPAILRIGLVNRALAQMGWFGVEQAIQFSPLLDGLIQQAQSKHQLSRIEELIAYACLGVHAGLEFDEHPTIKMTLSTVDRTLPDVSIIDALNDLSHEQWQQVNSDCQFALSGPAHLSARGFYG
jgi:hypothetical protein